MTVSHWKDDHIMPAPGWLDTISNHAIISKAELLDWLNINSTQLKVLLKEENFPPPRFTGAQSRPMSDRITSTSRWRVGDVRGWFEGQQKLNKELSTEIAAESQLCTQKARAAGYHHTGPRIKRF